MPLWINHVAQDVRVKSRNDIELIECVKCEYCGEQTPITELSRDEQDKLVCPICLK